MTATKTQEKKPRSEQSLVRRGILSPPIGKQTRVQEVCGTLTKLAHELGPNAKLPTVVQLRDRLGVSVTTINTVLSELEARQIVRRRHGVGIYVAPKIQQHRISLVCAPSFLSVSGPSPFWRILVEQANRRADSEREMLILHFSTEPLLTMEGAPIDVPALPEGLAEDIRQGRVDGVLGIGLSPATAEWIEEQNVPFVAFAGPANYTFALDSADLIRQAVRILAQSGCERIGYWTTLSPYRPLTYNIENINLSVFRDALQEAGQPFYSSLVRENYYLIPPEGGSHSVTHQEQGYHNGMKVFGPDASSSEWPDGIVSSDDMLTLGLLSALQRLKIPVGEELKIATHVNTDSPVLLGWEDRLIRLEVDPSEIVNGMFDTLESLMNGETLAPMDKEIKPQLRLPENP
jgi:DNA-binding LacI/PurR family transcriptional regulator